MWLYLCLYVEVVSLPYGRLIRKIIISIACELGNKFDAVLRQSFDFPLRNFLTTLHECLDRGHDILNNFPTEFPKDI
jgi:hypothetical protein